MPWLQDNQTLSKWSPRAKCGKFLGHSTSHSISVWEIFNLDTGCARALRTFSSIWKKSWRNAITTKLEWSLSLYFGLCYCSCLYQWLHILLTTSQKYWQENWQTKGVGIHKCTRFSHCPCCSHEQALIKLEENKAKRIDSDPASIKSCTGFVNLIGGYPVIWTSKL